MAKKQIKETEQKEEKVISSNETFSLFDKSNYMMMGIGLLCIILGYFLMAGGKSPDPNEFNYDQIYSFRRIVLAPMMVLAGFVIEIIAIMREPKNK